MSDTPETPQIYLITPSEFDLSTYPEHLARCLDEVPVACVRLALGTKDDQRIIKAADALREVTYQRDVALVIDSHLLLVEKLGLDGVHLQDGARSIKKARKALGDEAIVGGFCNNSRHDGMTAGELGADYISFGPAGVTTLGDGRQAEADLFAWWSMMIEVPVVAEGALNADLINKLAPHTDFFGIGDEVWASDDPATALKDLHRAMGG
ncbi:MAG: thiamine phosphate synthase [Pseudomonadota bacterium]